MAEHYETVWQFETASFRVEFAVAPEDMAPEDSFEFDDDVAAVRNGDVEWFCARVQVIVKADVGDGRIAEAVIGEDHLGGCAYHTVREFYTSHRDPDALNRNCSIMRGQNRSIGHYFPSMVAEAIDMARRTLDNLPTLRKED